MTVIELDVEIPDLAEVEVETPDTEITPSGGDTVVVVATPGPPGPQGPTGPAGDNAPIFNETPAGALNGANRVFTTSHTYQPGSSRIYLNGIRQRANYSYTETGPAEVTFDDPPLPADDLTIDYLIA